MRRADNADFFVHSTGNTRLRLDVQEIKGALLQRRRCGEPVEVSLPESDAVFHERGEIVEQRAKTVDRHAVAVLFARGLPVCGFGALTRCDDRVAAILPRRRIFVGEDVAVPSPRAVASLESGARMRATIMPTTRSRSGEPRDAKTRSSPICRSVRSTAATCPCGQLRSISSVSLTETRVSPRRMRRMASICCADRADRLASVRLRILEPSRHASRSRTAGARRGERKSQFANEIARTTRSHSRVTSAW